MAKRINVLYASDPTTERLVKQELSKFNLRHTYEVDLNIVSQSIAQQAVNMGSAIKFNDIALVPDSERREIPIEGPVDIFICEEKFWKGFSPKLSESKNAPQVILLAQAIPEVGTYPEYVTPVRKADRDGFFDAIENIANEIPESEESGREQRDESDEGGEATDDHLTNGPIAE